jgi:hypothetical protein
MPGTAQANIICIKWGDLYNSQDVNRLYAMVRRNVQSHELRFYCFTDNAEGLHPNIYARPIPEIRPAGDAPIKNIYRKLALCDDDLGGLGGQRVLFLDLDVLVVDELDTMLAWPQGDDFVIINDWHTPGTRVGQASCFSWRVGTLGQIKSDFESRPGNIIEQYHTACQRYLSDMVRATHEGLHFWPERWCKSFKFHALPPWWARPFQTPQLPEGVKVLAFHGEPKMVDALNGRWSERAQPVYKRLYKTIRPAHWIASHWHTRDLH